MELTRYLRVLRQRLWMIVACPIVAALAAGIVSFLLPPVYEAHVSLLVRPAQPLSTTDPNVANLTSDQISRTYASLMTKRPLLEAVSKELGLNIRPEDLAKQITVTPEVNTAILDVAVKDTNPALARDLANGLTADLIAEVKGFQQQETSLPNSRTGDNLFVVSPAVLPDRPVSPNKTLNIAIAFAAGLLLALGLAFLLDYLDQSIKTDEELTERLGLIPMGHLLFVPSGKGKRGELVALDGQSHASEAFRALRTSLLFSTIDQELKEVVVTSAELGEGKSRTAANLAIVLAEAGHKTLLIDADFRRPSQHRIFGRVRNIGLSNLIVEDATEAEAITAVEGVPNLWVLTSGPTPPNPSELLGSGRMRELMAKLRGYFTYLVVDTPPVNAVTDASILAAYASGTVLVVEQGRTTFPALKNAKAMLDRVGARTLGAVINKVHASSGSYAYAYGYYATSSNGRSGSEGTAVSKAEAGPASTKAKTS
ncbi:MAG TPA: polysaccharide biosynthesis tyrosine autokinase [Candidatus Nitrosotalea sp.]|nr:polysaccharide biosynthesis tyrosine autokinase [Candidatus Nitrosotalea sp.]